MLSLPMVIQEHSGIARIGEPVTVGVPFKKGLVQEPGQFRLLDHHGEERPLQIRILHRWPDGTIKWALLDCLVNIPAHSTTEYCLTHGRPTREASSNNRIDIHETSDAVVVDTGAAVFHISRRAMMPFSRVCIDGRDILDPQGSRLVLHDKSGEELRPAVHRTCVTARGPVRATIEIESVFLMKSGQTLRCLGRISFYAHSGLVEFTLTVHNPHPAQHPGGLWDLGDAGSILFRDLTLHLPLYNGSVKTSWSTRTDAARNTAQVHDLEIFQASSGGPNWNSHNHVNRDNEVTLAFSGYRVTADGAVVEQGTRGMPIITVETAPGTISASIADFWQNFPKAMSVQGPSMSLGVFPGQARDMHELQGGEQKTHTLFLEFSTPTVPGKGLAWVSDRSTPKFSADWWTECQVLPYLIPRSQFQEDAGRIIDSAVDGPNSVFARREMIDEYGWRHFGELFADHEIELPSGRWPLISHYNNQYDVVFGFLAQYLATGDRRWFQLLTDLARHVIDIDVYRTREDVDAYNGGLFWHTDHHVDAKTATHRAYSKQNAPEGRAYGGGPSNEHNYTSGLMYYYFLTGNEDARTAVLLLADWVIKMDDGSRRFLGWADRRPTGLASGTAERGYQGPGRGAGNSINACLDAYVLSDDRRYLAKAEALIRRCIHPQDRIEDRQLDHIEDRWSYTVFLQVLGKYLDLKEEHGQLDDGYAYARASLLLYARWMVEHEVPYKQVFDRVKIPSSTWPAQDIRKAVVFDFAAKHADEPMRTVFLQKAEFFFESCLKDLLSFDTWNRTRPVVILMGNSFVHDYFRRYPETTAARPHRAHDGSPPVAFRPQFCGLYAFRDKVKAFIGR
jgi:hypothetical protein